MQLDGLVAELTSALSLEEFKLGGSSNDESFSMVSEGAGGRCIPLGAVSSESSSSLRLPPRVPACAGRGILGGGGAIWIAGLALALAWVKGETPLVQHSRLKTSKSIPYFVPAGPVGRKRQLDVV